MSIITEHQTPSSSFIFTPSPVQRPAVLLSAKKYHEVLRGKDSELSGYFLREHLTFYRNYLAGQSSGMDANDAYAEKVLQMLETKQYGELPPLPTI